MVSDREWGPIGGEMAGRDREIATNNGEREREREREREKKMRSEEEEGGLAF